MIVQLLRLFFGKVSYTVAFDNLDQNPSSTTSKTSFHGTGISLFQFPSEREPGVIRQPVIMPPSGSQTYLLSDSYASS